MQIEAGQGGCQTHRHLPGNVGLRGSAAAGLLLLSALGGCSSLEFLSSDEGPSAPQSASSIRISPEEISLTAIGATSEVQAVVLDGQGHPIRNVKVDWSSSDPSVATVDPSGVVTATGEGRVEIRARYRHLETSANARVAPIPKGIASIAITPDEPALSWIGQTLELRALAIDAAGEVISEVMVDWRSSLSSVASIDDHGILQAVIPGKTTITATLLDGSISAETTARVRQIPARLIFLEHPSSTTAGVPMEADVSLEILDAGDVRIAVEPFRVLLDCQHGSEFEDCGAALSEDGVATFVGVSPERAGDEVVLVARAEKAAPATSVSFSVYPGAPEKLLFAAPPSHVEALVPFDLAVAVADRFGNPTSEAEVGIDLALEEGGELTLVGELHARTVQGIAGFAGLTVDGPGAFRINASTQDGWSAVLSGEIRSSYVFTQLVAGENHSCGLLRSGVALCFGSNGAGQLGADISMSASMSHVPTRAAEGLTFANLDAGDGYTCGVTLSRELHCWGSVPGQGAPSHVPVPIVLPPGESAWKIAAGKDHLCTLAESGLAFCLGANQDGQVGDGSVTPRTSLTPVGDLHFSDITLGESFTCGINAETTHCWGSNSHGQLGGASSEEQVSSPAEITSLRLSSISAGSLHVCGITLDGGIICWGSGTYGQLGGEGFPDSSLPAPVVADEDDAFFSISAGSHHGCASTRQGRTLCWGLGTSGQLGSDYGFEAGQIRQATDIHQEEEQSVLELVAAGAGHTCGVGANGVSYCWGDGAMGRLGAGEEVEDIQPYPVVVRGTER